MLKDTNIPSRFKTATGGIIALIANAAHTKRPYRHYRTEQDEKTERFEWLTREKAIAEFLKAQINKEAHETRNKPPKPSGEITATDLLNRKIESIPCLIEPIFQRVGLAAVAGSSDVGKSMFLRQFAFAVGTGQEEFLGWKIRSKHKSAIYVSTEDDENATAFLLYSLNKIQGHDPDDCNGLRFIFETHDLLNELDRRLTNAPADVVVIDAFGDLYIGDANKTNQIRQFLHNYSQLAQKHDCLILWLHHTGKRTDDEAPSKHHVIGGQGFEGKMRLLIELRRDHYDNSLRHLCIVKGNYLSDEYKSKSYVLGFEDFQFTQTGKRVAFDELSKPKDEPDTGQQKYDKIQKARKLGHSGQALADYLEWSKAYISQIEKKYGPKEKSEPKLTDS